MLDLFRPEVFEQRQRDWLGSILLIRPPTLAFLTTCAVLAASTLGIFLAIGGYTRTARVSGYLVADRGLVSGGVTAPEPILAPTAAPATPLPADARLQAQLFAPARTVGLVRPAQAVRLRYPAFAQQTVGERAGEVTEVSRVPLQSAEVARLPQQGGTNPASEPLYRITVRLDRQSVFVDGQAQALAPGMLIEADILLERRRLIEWLFAPALSAAGRV